MAAVQKSVQNLGKQKLTTQKKVLVIMGTRPEAIKLASVIHELKKSPDLDVKICASGQHTDLITQVSDLFGFEIDFWLDTMEQQQSLNQLSSKILGQFDKVLADMQPDVLLVHGDTTTTAVAAMAGYYRKIPVGHVEAGLRTNDIYAPWPEEGNRKLVSTIAALHFAPTDAARSNLLAENVAPEIIHVTGNTVIDAISYMDKRIATSETLQEEMHSQFSFLDPEKRTILVTCHRRENHESGIVDLCEAIAEVATKRDDIQFVFPVHPNPAVRTVVEKRLSDVSNVWLIQPQDYVNFVYLMRVAYLILSDSGGIQEEAPTLATPVLVLRDQTERPEAVEAGTVKLVGSKTSDIISAVETLLDHAEEHARMATANNPFGDGTAAKKIRQLLEQYLG